MSDSTEPQSWLVTGFMSWSCHSKFVPTFGNWPPHLPNAQRLWLLNRTDGTSQAPRRDAHVENHASWGFGLLYWFAAADFRTMPDAIRRG